VHRCRLRGPPSKPAGLAVAGRSPVELAPEAVQLTQLVLDHAHHRVTRRAGQVPARTLNLRQGGVPVTLELQDLGPVHQALPPAGPQILLGITPAAERDRPLLRTAKVGHFPAGDDDAAVDDPRHDGRHLTGGHGHHGLVQHAHAPCRIPQLDECLVLSQADPRGGHVPRRSRCPAHLITLGVRHEVARVGWIHRLETEEVEDAARSGARWPIPACRASLVTVGCETQVIKATGCCCVQWPQGRGEPGRVSTRA
jgi:hypothetical protein